MSDEEQNGRSREDAELEREIRSQRKFSLAEAIGRTAGDLMKGASPVTLKRQAEIEIEQFLEAHFADTEGALTVVLLRRVLESELLLEGGCERPLAAMAGVSEQILASPARLGRFVRRVDAEWGRIYSERPFFETGEAPADPDDPYTVASVRELLTRLRQAIADETSGDD